jgi:predicted DNA binding CopG/RHH family protein
MAQERKLTVRISEEEYRPVRVKAAELGRPISEIVRELLAGWVSGEIELPMKTKEKTEET